METLIDENVNLEKLKDEISSLPIFVDKLEISDEDKLKENEKKRKEEEKKNEEEEEKEKKKRRKEENEKRMLKKISIILESEEKNSFIFTTQATKTEKSKDSRRNTKLKDFFESYTPMQFAAKYGLKSIVKKLLTDPEVDPNLCGGTLNQKYRRPSLWPQKSRDDRQTSHNSQSSGSNNSTKCKKPPVILAAEYGQPEILRLFKDHRSSIKNTSSETINEESDNGNISTPRMHSESKISVQFKEPNEKTNRECSDNEGTALIMLPSTTSNATTVRFDVISEEDKDTVLHAVLRQPILERQRILERDEKTSRKVAEQRKSLRIQKFESLPELEFIDRELSCLSKDYRECMNILLDMDEFKGDDGVYKGVFPEQIRCIVNNKNCRDNGKNTALHYAASNWPSAVVEKLLGLGANPSLKNKYNEIPLTRISKSTFESFMDKRCIFVKEFDASDNEMEQDGTGDDSPQNISQDYDQSFMMKISRCGKDQGNKMTFDYSFLRPRKDSKDRKTSKDSSYTQQDNDNENSGENERSKESEMDVLWELSQSEELRSLITHPVIDSFLWAKWKLMTKFNNRMLRIRFLFLYSILWNTFTTFGGYNWMSIELSGENLNRSIINDVFCKDLYHYPKVTTVWNQDHFKLSSLWYFIFLVIVLIQLTLIIRDYFLDSDERVASWIDFFNLSLSLSILVCGDTVLWIVITLLLIFYTLSELAEIFAVRKKYFVELSNFFDVTMIVLTFVVLYVPQSMILNPKTFSIHEDAEDGSGCQVKRSMSAFIIVLVWSRFLMSFAQCPFLKEYNLYLIMFTKVIQTYLKIMLWFASYIIAFGLGFYIMLHGDIDSKSQIEKRDNSTFCIYNKTSEKCILDFPKRPEDDKTKFDAPFLALIKTGTMFIGEFDFDDLPMDGGNFSVSIAYVFLLAFIFVIVIVLVNLLNGLAVSDTQQMINDSKIEIQISFIQAIRYIESVYLDAGKLPRFLGNIGDKDVFKMNLFFRKVFPMKLFLFSSSKHMTDNRLVFPLQEKESKSKNDEDIQQRNESCFTRFKNWLTKSDPNFKAESFLRKARKILIRLKKLKQAERKQKQLKKEIEKLEERKRFEHLRNETYFEQTQKMETMLQKLISNQIQDHD